MGTEREKKMKYTTTLILGAMILMSQLTLAGECSFTPAQATRILQGKAAVLGAVKEAKNLLKTKTCEPMRAEVTEGDTVTALIACNSKDQEGFESSILINISAEGWCSGDLFIQNIKFDFAG